MLTHEESTTLLDSTMSLLEGEQPDTTPQNGASLIESWLAELHKAENATDIVNTLDQVKTQLTSQSANMVELSDLLNKLATQTAEFSTMMGSEGDMATRLEALSSALRSLAGQAGNAS
jgi:ABC-type transporter Mla subunit MlaD